jgi:hypothetical protein
VKEALRPFDISKLNWMRPGLQALRKVDALGQGASEANPEARDLINYASQGTISGLSAFAAHYIVEGFNYLPSLSPTQTDSLQPQDNSCASADDCQ